MDNFEYMVNKLDGYTEGTFWNTNEQKELESLALIESVMLPGIVVSKKVYTTKHKIVWEATDIA
jgi:hypothetical protein